MKHFDIKLISKISHEVMSPVISSKWALEILLNDKDLSLPNDRRVFLERIYSNLNRVSTISNKLINYSRYTVNELLPIYVDFDLSNALRKIVGELKRDFPVADIKLFISDSVFFVNADQSMVEFLFHSILHNAIVYSNIGAEILVKLDKTLEGVVSFEVVDKGIGIPHADQHKIFTEFFRSSIADSLYAKGIGISLFLCKRICEICDYKISFTSTENQGSNFNVLFKKT